jgi:hypothetical protein
MGYGKEQVIKTRNRRVLWLACVLVVLGPTPGHTEDKVVCIKSTAVTTRTLRITSLIRLVDGTTCPSGYQLLFGSDSFQGPAGIQGDQGDTGAAGATGGQGLPGKDGSLRVFGDGSAGICSPGGDVTDTNKQCTDIIIASGQTAKVPSGTVLRCTGRFENYGTIIVSPYAQGGLYGTSIKNGDIGALQPAHPGISRVVAGNGLSGPPSTAIEGGEPGLGLTEAEARTILKPGPLGGGGGGAASLVGGYNLAGSQGGGTITILCAGGITNAGSILANGQKPSTPEGVGGAGGGAGGIVIIASQGSITNTGDIETKGSNGLAPFPAGYNAGGGGGGGGIVHLLAPSVDVLSGTIDVSGGKGWPAGTIPAGAPAYRGSGGSGGSLGGAGGYGGSWTEQDTYQESQDGKPGYILTTNSDPTGLF